MNILMLRDGHASLGVFMLSNLRVSDVIGCLTHRRGLLLITVGGRRLLLLILNMAVGLRSHSARMMKDAPSDDNAAVVPRTQLAVEDPVAAFPVVVVVAAAVVAAAAKEEI